MKKLQFIVIFGYQGKLATDTDRLGMDIEVKIGATAMQVLDTLVDKIAEVRHIHHSKIVLLNTCKL